MADPLTNEELLNVLGFLNQLDSGTLGPKAKAFMKLYVRISEGCSGLINFIDDQHSTINNYQQAAMMLKRYYEDETGNMATWPDIATMIDWIITEHRNLR